ncbi:MULTISPECIES: hypothetical protein [unclassified Chryseobacterium]|uniref:hypothetical protein n=1 Tax=unclassified Chryseobacterium TaxID=2593645 RepID=UPI0030197D1A
MAKQITQAQFDKLKELRRNLDAFTSIDSRIGILVHIDQILNDIDGTSAFHTNLTTELIYYKSRREKYENFNTLTAIISNAINYYEGEL